MPTSKFNASAFLNTAGTIYAASNDGFIDPQTTQDMLMELATSIAQDITGVSSAPEAPPPNKSILTRMEWAELNNTRCRSLTRFGKPDIERMISALRLPTPFFRTKSRSKIPIEIAFCIILARLATPHRLVDLEDIFGYPREVISETFNQLGSVIFDQWAKPLLTSWNDTLLTPSRLDLYCLQSIRPEHQWITSGALWT
ncbi:unnamed protein product [Rhizoctonia solani]|nr:unnamed protein product [Rhizoctonia solani]